MHSVKSVVIGAGGKIEKEAGATVNNKVLLGDKFGQVSLFDAGRKLILDKKGVFEGATPRQIISISTASLIWLETKLTYVAVAARGIPIVKILVFKHSENKLYHLYSLNTCPHLPNPESLDTNPDQSYLELPCEVKLSYEFGFMSITSFGGEVRVVKLPAVINPNRESDDQ